MAGSSGQPTARDEAYARCTSALLMKMHDRPICYSSLRNGPVPGARLPRRDCPWSEDSRQSSQGRAFGMDWGIWPRFMPGDASLTVRGGGASGTGQRRRGAVPLGPGQGSLWWAVWRRRTAAPRDSSAGCRGSRSGPLDPERMCRRHGPGDEPERGGGPAIMLECAQRPGPARSRRRCPPTGQQWNAGARSGPRAGPSRARHGSTPTRRVGTAHAVEQGDCLTVSAMRR